MKRLTNNLNGQFLIYSEIELSRGRDSLGKFHPENIPKNPEQNIKQAPETQFNNSNIPREKEFFKIPRKCIVLWQVSKSLSVPTISIYRKELFVVKK